MNQPKNKSFSVEEALKNETLSGATIALNKREEKFLKMVADMRTKTGSSVNEIMEACLKTYSHLSTVFLLTSVIPITVAMSFSLPFWATPILVVLSGILIYMSMKAAIDYQLASSILKNTMSQAVTMADAKAAKPKEIIDLLRRLQAEGYLKGTADIVYDDVLSHLYGEQKDEENSRNTISTGSGGSE